MAKALDLTSEAFGKLTVVRLSDRRDSRGNRHWWCRCSCGKRRLIEVSGPNLRNGHTTSCGCAHADAGPRIAAALRKYIVDSRSRLYILWRSIKQRTCNPKCTSYPDYGGRGIRMYGPWLSDKAKFFDYVLALPNCPTEYLMGPPSSLDPIPLSIDRRDNDKGYVPGNLRWATRSMQQRNKRNSTHAARRI